MEPTLQCDQCAHAMVAEQQAEIDRLRAERSEVLKWLRQDRLTKALRVLREAGDDNATR